MYVITNDLVLVLCSLPVFCVCSMRRSDSSSEIEMCEVMYPYWLDRLAGSAVLARCGPPYSLKRSTEISHYLSWGPGKEWWDQPMQDCINKQFIKRWHELAQQLKQRKKILCLWKCETLTTRQHTCLPIFPCLNQQSFDLCMSDGNQNRCSSLNMTHNQQRLLITIYRSSRKIEI